MTVLSRRRALSVLCKPNWKPNSLCLFKLLKK
jgi:hypothetical protein